MLVKSKFEGYSRDGCRVYPCDGGDSGGNSTTVQSSGPPEWVKGYAKDVLGRSSALTDINANPYQKYPDERIAGFGDLQKTAQTSALNMGSASQLSDATSIARTAANRGLNAGYNPSYFSNQFEAPAVYQPEQFSYMGVNAPSLQQYQMSPAERVGAREYGTPEMRAAQTGFRPDLQQFQMGPAERAQTQSFTQPGSAEAYMSPFMQNVVDKQVREAERQAGLAAKQERAQSIQRGAFGGGRTAVREAAAARDLAQLKSDIYGTGQQAAFQNAQQQFNAEQQARMQAQLANQQAGLTVGGQNLAAQLGVQQLGTQTGLQTALSNLSNRQQANVQNQAARLQTQGLNAQQAMQAALANQQAGLTVGQQNLAAQLGVQQLGSGQNMQAQLAEQQAYQDMLRQREASRQFGYGQQMNAAQQRAQYGQAANQLMEQSRQYGAGLGLQGIQAAITGATQLGNLGQQQFGQEKDIIGLQSQLGGQEQALRQQKATQDYQDFLAQQRYPYQQLEFMSNILRGTPMGTMSTMYQQQAAPSTASQLGSLGLGAYGLSRLFKEGGAVDSYAEGGDVDSEENVTDIVDSLSDEQLPQSMAAAQARGDMDQVLALQREMAKRKVLRAAEQRSMSGGLGGAFNSLPQESQDRVLSAANGGIVAFSRGGNSDSAIENDDASETDSFLESLMGTPGNPATYASLSALYPKLLARIAKMERPAGMTAKEAEAFEKKYVEEETKAAGESPYAKMRAQIAEMQAGRGEERKRSQGFAALMAAGAMGKTPGGFMRGLSAAMEQAAPVLMSAQQADKAEARSIANMELNLADAERKERMGLRRDARAARALADKDKIEAGKFAIEREKMLAGLASQGMRNTKPVATRTSSSPTARDQFGVDALMPLIKQQYPNLPPDQQRAMAFERLKQLGGPGLEGTRERVQAQVNSKVVEAMENFANTAEGNQARKLAKKGDTAGADQIRREYEARVRKTAEAELGGGGGGGGARQVLRFDAQGQQIR